MLERPVSARLARTLFTAFALFFIVVQAPLGDESDSDLGLDATLSALKAVMRWDPLSSSGTFEVGPHRIVFKVRSGRPDASESAAFVLDSSLVLRAKPPYLVSGELRFPRSFVDAAKAAVERASEVEKSRFRIAAILVDPGHGGKDTGAIGNHVLDGKKLKLVEKDLVLDIAKSFYERLVAAYPDKRVLLTRTGDTYPSLEQRVAAANSMPLEANEAIVFVSIHANASFNKSARGYEVWYLSPEYRRTLIDEKNRDEDADVLPILNAMLEEEFTTESIIMARNIMSRFDEAIGRNGPSRGIKAEEWFVVRNARMPSVLVEVGFVTNPDDARLLADDAYLRKLSDALYKGTVDFVAAFEKSGGFTAQR